MSNNEPTQLTTVADIVKVFNTVDNNAEVTSAPESISLLKDLTALFLAKPANEIAAYVAITDTGLVSDTLVRMVGLYENGSEERKAVVAKRLSLVDEFVKAGQHGVANAWLVRGYCVYPGGSEEQMSVVAKGVSLVDEFVKAGNFDLADTWLVRGYAVYPSGSEEQKAVVAKGEQILSLKSSKQMGAAPKIDIGALSRIAKQELAKIRVAGLSH